jgi:heme/copper-type cytochrome/quinol oxidase subunit 2
MTVETNSIIQVVLIAVIKFLLLVCPTRSRSLVTNKLIVALFFVLWLVSACVAFSDSYFAMQKVKTNEDVSPVLMVYLIVTTVLSTLAIIILHVIKVVKLRKSQALQDDVRKMNKVVTIILGIYIVYNIQKIVFALKIERFEFLEKSIRVSALTHHACNPLIYAAFTPLVKKSWQRLKEMFGIH